MSEAEEALRATLAQLAAERDQRLVGINAQIAQTQGAMATAGNEYEDQIAAANAAAAQAATDYDGFLGQTSSNLAAGQDAIDQIDTAPPSTDPIDDIAIPSGPVDGITINTGGTPDCSAADIEAAVNDGLTQLRASLAPDIEAAVNAALDQIRDAINKLVENLSNGNIDQTKTALQKLLDTGQGMRDQLPPATDNDVQKAADHAFLDGLF